MGGRNYTDNQIYANMPFHGLLLKEVIYFWSKFLLKKCSLSEPSEFFILVVKDTMKCIFYSKYKGSAWTISSRCRKFSPMMFISLSSSLVASVVVWKMLSLGHPVKNVRESSNF